jgi:hypothetical protein
MPTGKDFPSFEEGSLRPLGKMSRYLSQGAAGEVRSLLQQRFDLPGRAEIRVALHLLGRRGHPSFEEGIGLFWILPIRSHLV